MPEKFRAVLANLDFHKFFEKSTGGAQFLIFLFLFLILNFFKVCLRGVTYFANLSARTNF